AVVLRRRGIRAVQKQELQQLEVLSKRSRAARPSACAYRTRDAHLRGRRRTATGSSNSNWVALRAIAAVVAQRLALSGERAVLCPRNQRRVQVWVAGVHHVPLQQPPELLCDVL